jgi:phosphoribosylanthranilate isomerase
MKRVGVFVNEKTDRILNRVSQYTLDFVQLHGNESPEQCRELQHKGVKIIKAFPVDRDFDFKSVDAYSDFVSYFLFDTKGRYFGGNSTPFEWTLLERYHQSVPFFLSGGISTQNISAIKKINNPNFYALDVNSGVEFSPGVKDVNRIKELKRVLSSL